MRYNRRKDDPVAVEDAAIAVARAVLKRVCPELTKEIDRLSSEDCYRMYELIPNPELVGGEKR